MKRTNWFIYTVLIGLVPLFVRLIIYLISTNKDVNYVCNSVEIISFGLVLLITNINELEGDTSFNEVTRKWYKGLSIVFAVLFAAFLGIAYLSENPKATEILSINPLKIRDLSLGMTLISFLMSFSIYYRFKSKNMTSTVSSSATS